MTPDWNVLMVAISESFRTTLEGMVRELGALPVPWKPIDGRAPVDGPVLVLGGGVETDAIDLVAELDKARPVFVVGASTDHRIGSASVRAGGARLLRAASRSRLLAPDTGARGKGAARRG
jgi:hypothetical protein